MWEDVLNLQDYVLILRKMCLQWQKFLHICEIKPAWIHIKPAYSRIKPAEIVMLRTCVSAVLTLRNMILNLRSM